MSLTRKGGKAIATKLAAPPRTTLAPAFFNKTSFSFLIIKISLRTSLLYQFLIDRLQFVRTNFDRDRTLDHFEGNNNSRAIFSSKQDTPQSRHGPADNTHPPPHCYIRMGLSTNALFQTILHSLYFLLGQCRRTTTKTHQPYNTMDL